MPLPVVPTESPNEKQHRAIIATILNELVKGTDSGTFTATLTGVTTVVTGTAYYERNFNTVTLLLPTLSGTSNATTATITGLPQALWPRRDQGFEHPIIADNGAFALGTAQLKTTGVITLWDDDIGTSTTNWTNSGTKSVFVFLYTYLLI